MTRAYASVVPMDSDVDELLEVPAPKPEAPKPGHQDPLWLLLAEHLRLLGGLIGQKSVHDGKSASRITQAIRNSNLALNRVWSEQLPANAGWEDPHASLHTPMPPSPEPPNLEKEAIEQHRFTQVHDLTECPEEAHPHAALRMRGTHATIEPPELVSELTAATCRRHSDEHTLQWFMHKVQSSRVLSMKQLNARYDELAEDAQKVSAWENLKLRDTVSSCHTLETKGIAGTLKSKNKSQSSKGSNVKRSLIGQVVVEEDEPEEEQEGAKRKRSALSMFSLTNTTKSPAECLKHNWSRMERLVRSDAFDLAFAVIIVMNALIMALNLQYTGMELGYRLQFPQYDKPADQRWVHGEVVLSVLDKMFVIIYTVELMLRFAVERSRWFHTAWNYVDLVIVIVAYIGWLASEFLVNPTIIRIARLGRLLRIIKVMRSTAVIGCLKVLAAALQGSVNVLFWAIGVILLIQVAASMSLSQMVEPYIADESNPLEVRQRVFGYYGTFWRSLITMFEITFANWAPACRILTDYVGEVFGLFFLVYRCAIGFAVLSVVQAVFIQQTMKSAQLDDDMLMMQQKAEREKIVKRLTHIFLQLDESGDGFISWEEFSTLVDSMEGMLRILEVEVRDLYDLFTLLDDGDGQISLQEFVSGIPSLRGNAKAVDMRAMLCIARRIEHKMDMFEIRGGFLPLDTLTERGAGMRPET